jgi:hypothetical protein
VSIKWLFVGLGLIYATLAPLSRYAMGRS